MRSDSPQTFIFDFIDVFHSNRCAWITVRTSVSPPLPRVMAVRTLVVRACRRAQIGSSHGNSRQATDLISRKNPGSKSRGFSIFPVARTPNQPIFDCATRSVRGSLHNRSGPKRRRHLRQYSYRLRHRLYPDRATVVFRRTRCRYQERYRMCR